MSGTSPGAVGEPLIIATDGSLRGRHRGTWGWVRQGGAYAVGSTTLSQRSSTVVELVAVLEALRATPVGATVHLRSDSQSALQYLTGAAAVTGVQPASSATVRRMLTREGSLDVVALARAARDLCRERNVTAHWVKGHAEDELNIRVDALIAEVQCGQLPSAPPRLDAPAPGSFAPCEVCGASTHPTIHPSLTAAERVGRLTALHDVINAAPQARFAPLLAPRVDIVCAGAVDLSGMWAWFSTNGTYAVGALRGRFDTADPAAPHRASLAALAEAIAATPSGAEVHISARSAAIRSLTHVLRVTSTGHMETLPPVVKRGLRGQLDHLIDLCSERAVTIHELRPGMPGAAAIARLLADGAAASLRKRSVYVQAYVTSFRHERRLVDVMTHCDCGVRVVDDPERKTSAASASLSIAAPNRARAQVPQSGTVAAMTVPGALPETYAALDRVAAAAEGGGVLR